MLSKQMQKILTKALEEEEEKETNQALLDELRKLAAEDPEYLVFNAADRNALNTFFDEVKDLLFQELLNGNYGAQILLDSFFVLCFEVGHKLGRQEK